MSIFKDSRLVGGTAFDYFQVQVDDCARKFDFGSTWTRLRVGCRFVMANDPGSAWGAGSPAPLAFGLQKSAGETYGATGKVASHHLLMRCANLGYTRNAGPPATFQAQNASDSSIQAYHNSTQDFAGTFATHWKIGTNPNYAQAMILDVTKGATDWTAVAIYCSSATPTLCTHSELLTALLAADTTAMLAELPAGEYTAKTATVTGMAARVASYGDFDELVFSAGFLGAGLIVGDFMAQKVS